MSQATERAWVIERHSSVGGGDRWEPLSGIEPRSLASCRVDLQVRATVPRDQGRTWRLRNIATRDIIDWPMPA
jgi:hypothetical protein